MPRQFRSLQLAILAVIVFPAFAWAQSVTVVVRPENEDLQARMLNASLSSAAIENEDSRPEDILAAAQSEYATMVGVLYSQAHFAGEVSVQVDGREASDISPFERPASINAIQIVVTPGPQFTFGKLDVSPLTPRRGTFGITLVNLAPFLVAWVHLLFRPHCCPVSTGAPTH